MFRKFGQFNLFKILGFKVTADWSWLIVAFLMSWSLAAGYFPASYPAASPGVYVLMGILSAALMFLSVVLHEVGHSYVARLHGIHILGIRLFVFGGVAQLEREPDSPDVELEIALAGPVVSMALAFVYYVSSVLLGVIMAAPLAAITLLLAKANLAMALFNLIPGFPMDGGRILRAFLWKRNTHFYAATRTATAVGKAVAYGFMAIGALAFLSGNFGNGLWILFIGLFLLQAAQASYAHAARAAIAQEFLPLDFVGKNHIFESPELLWQRTLRDDWPFNFLEEEPFVRPRGTIREIDLEPDDRFWLRRQPKFRIIRVNDFF